MSSSAMLNHPGALPLKTASVYTMCGQIAYCLAQWVQLIILAKCSSPVDVGVYSLGLAISAPIMMLCNLQLRTVLVSDAKCEYVFGEYAALRIIMSLLGLIAITCICIVIDINIYVISILVLIAAYKVIESISDIYWGFFQYANRLDIVSISMCMKGIAAVVGFAVGLWAFNSLRLAVMILCCGWLLIMIFYDVLRAYNLSKRIRNYAEGNPGCFIQMLTNFSPSANPYRLRSLAASSLPLGFVMMLIALISAVPRYLIERYIGTYEVGIFTAIFYVMFAGGTVVSSIGQPAVPLLAGYAAEKRPCEFLNLIVRYSCVNIVIGVSGIVVSILCGETIMAILYTAEYRPYQYLLTLCMVCASISYLATVPGMGVTACRQFRMQMYSYILVSVVCILACFIFIPRFGLIGGGFAVLITMCTQLIGSTVMLAIAFRKTFRCGIVPSLMSRVFNS